MRTLLFIFSALILLALAIAGVFFSGHLFDASRKIEIQPYVFQPAELSTDRIGRPIPLSELEHSDSDYVLTRLIAAFIREYHSVIPYPGDLETRAGQHSPLAAMTVGSQTPVFANWVRNVKPELAALAESRKLRRVLVHRDRRVQGEYYVVRFDLFTYNPNDPDARPEIILDQQMLLRIRYEHGMRTELMGQPFDARRALESGRPPMLVFKFVVDEVR